MGSSDGIDDEQLRREMAALADRVLRIERELAQLRQIAPAAILESAPERGAPARVPPFEPRRNDQGAPSTSSGSRANPTERLSFESRIGSHIFNRIGIIALLVGVAWFLKFAIDKHWIGPLARVLIGTAGGAAIILWSEWFRRRRYNSFAYSLKALGSGVLYLALWAAYSLFGLLSAGAALCAMVLVTATNAWLAWQQNSELLAFYAAIGGLLAPLLLWAAEGREATLFTYLLVLDLAVLLLVMLRPWSRLLLAAVAGTAAYAVAWYVQRYTPAALGLTAFYVTVFFLLFSAAPQLLRNLRLATAGARLTFEDELTLGLLPLCNGLLAFAEVYALLSEPVRPAARSWVGFAFAGFYLAMLIMARRLPGTPARLPATYLLLGVLALTGAIPLALHGRWIAVFWSAESMLLLTAGWRFGEQLLRSLSVSVLMLASIASILMHAGALAQAWVPWNPRFLTYLAAIAASAYMAWVAGRAARQASANLAESATAPEDGLAWQRAGTLATVSAVGLLMVGVCLEIHDYWRSQQQLSGPERLLDEQFTYSAWTMLFGIASLAAGFWRRLATLRWLGLLLLASSIGKVSLFDLRELSQGYRILSFLGLGASLLAVSFVYQRHLRRAPATPVKFS